MRIVVRAFLEECPRHIRELRDSISNQDTKTAHRLAHLIKGAMMTLAVPTVETTAQELENICATGELTVAAAQFKILEPALLKVCEILTQFVNGSIDPC